MNSTLAPDISHEPVTPPSPPLHSTSFEENPSRFGVLIAFSSD
jgi:hypothetical protein